MRLFEAIIDANHRAVAGDNSAGLRPAEFADDLPIVALTCVDPRLNPLLPEVLGIPEEHFIWLRNAGNIITGPLSSTMRSLALACAVKGGQEIVVIGHSDCQICKTTITQLLDRFKAQGVERHHLPENLTEFFGMFGSERQNVIKACDFIRHSPLIGPAIRVHGFLVDIETGKLEWVVNGYEAIANTRGKWNEVVRSAGESVDALRAMADFKIGEMKFPETRIGETVTNAGDWLSQKIHGMEISASDSPAPPETVSSQINVAKKVVQFAETHWRMPGGAPPEESVPPKLPLPGPIRPRMTIRRK